MMGFMDLYLRMKIRRREKKKKSGNICEHAKRISGVLYNNNTMQFDKDISLILYHLNVLAAFKYHGTLYLT